MVNSISKRQINELLTDKLFDELMKGMTVILTFSLILTAASVYVLFRVEPHGWVVLWLAINLIVTGLRFYIMYLRQNQGYPVNRLKNYTYILSLLAGMVWGSLALFYSPNHPLALQLMLVIILGGMPIVSMSTHSNLLPSHLLFATPPVIGLNYWALFETPEYAFNFVVITLLYSFLIYSGSLQFSRRVKESYVTNLENESLVAELQERQSQLENLAYIDSLTELSNRRYFTVSSELALEAIYRKNARLYFFLVDADKFKHINDQYGHASGDAVLKHIATCLTKSVESFNQNPLFEQGQTAEAARLGGDEFIISYVVLDENFDIDDTANALLNQIHQPMEVSDKIIYPQVSIGVSEAPRQARDVSGLLRLADKAMYQAKKRGGDQVFYCLATEVPDAENANEN